MPGLNTWRLFLRAQIPLTRIHIHKPPSHGRNFLNPNSFLNPHSFLPHCIPLANPVI